jgi:hypothetical protein
MSLLSKFFGADKKENFELSPPDQRPVTARRKHSDCSSLTMRSGVQRAKALRQRPARLAWIAATVKQGLEARKE